jgi:hypothetical protein
MAFFERKIWGKFGSLIAKKVIEFAAQGLKTELVEVEEANRRLEICERCPFFSDEYRICKECGCKMDFKVTLKYIPYPFGGEKKIVNCPKQKW